MKAAGAFRLGVIILGAGASSRMGRPKLLLPWNGTSIIGHLIRQWESLDASQIAVVCRPDDQPLHAELDRFPRHGRIGNSQPGRGMFSSILCAANWNGWNSELTSWAVVLGDQPHLRPETLRQLLEFAAQNRDAICQPAFGGRAGHPVILPRRALGELKNSRVATLKDFLKPMAGSRVLQCEVNDTGLSLDLDTPEDYKHLNFSREHEKL